MLFDISDSSQNSILQKEKKAQLHCTIYLLYFNKINKHNTNDSATSLDVQ